MTSPAERLKRAIVSGAAVHAFLITGSDLENAASLARECSALLLFGTEKTEKLENSPDYFLIEGSTGIDELRAVRRELYKRTFSGKNRVVCIKNVHLLNDNAVNAMLKMLEEPPDGTYFLLTGFELMILPTIRSRCFIVRIGSISKNEITETLAVLGAARGEAKKYASAACGSAERAARLYKDEAYRELREQALNAFFDILNGRLPFKWSKSLSRDRDAAKESINFMLFACHDLMLLKCGLSVDANADKQIILNDFASRFTLGQIRGIIDRLIETNMRLNTNSSVNQSLDGLIVGLTEVK